MPNEFKEPGQAKLGSEQLKAFFVNHLNRIYFAKDHLVQKLPSLKEKATFKDLIKAIDDTVNDVQKQLARLEEIYELLDEPVCSKPIHGLSGLINDVFEAIEEQVEEAELRDLSIAYYMQSIESLEMSSFQVLQMAAVKLKSKQISQLLKENYDESKADRTLLLWIAAKYLTQ